MTLDMQDLKNVAIPEHPAYTRSRQKIVERKDAGDMVWVISGHLEGATCEKSFILLGAYSSRVRRPPKTIDTGCREISTERRASNNVRLRSSGSVTTFIGIRSA